MYVFVQNLLFDSKKKKKRYLGKQADIVSIRIQFALIKVCTPYIFYMVVCTSPLYTSTWINEFCALTLLLLASRYIKIRCFSFCRVEVSTLYPFVDFGNCTCIRQCELPVNQQVKQHLLAWKCKMILELQHVQFAPCCLYRNLNSISLRVLWNIDSVCPLLL